MRCARVRVSFEGGLGDECAECSSGIAEAKRFLLDFLFALYLDVGHLFPERIRKITIFDFFG